LQDFSKIFASKEIDLFYLFVHKYNCCTQKEDWKKKERKETFEVKRVIN